jgi:photosystem II stability/assembly factor-like uncharacterized protein
MYAAPASGGVYKSLDGAESWFPLWHDEPSLSMASLSICASKPAVVWAGTGETDDARSGTGLPPAAGVLRSGDGGATWSEPDTLEPIREVLIHAVAAHPAREQVCWAVSREGVYRTLDGGATWTTFAAGRSFSDVAFAQFADGLHLFLVHSGPVAVAGPPGPATSNRGLVVRIDDPDADDAAIATILPDELGGAEPSPHPLLAHGSPTPPPATGASNPADGKIAIHDDAANAHAHPVVYVAFANSDDHLLGIFRCRNAHTADADKMTFTALVPAASMPFVAATATKAATGEEQGDYNLALAVSPADPNHVAFGMQNLYVNRKANDASPAAGHWRLAQQGDLYVIERGHHADHHALVFAEVAPKPFNGPFAEGAVLLWDANDGGLSASADWSSGASYVKTPLPANLPEPTLPLPDRVITWKKRSHGITGTQMYDLAQHPKLPTVLGCGFQDNGAWIGTGGPSWEFVLSADGAFVAFDPDDPYRALATWQHGVADCRFPGRLRDARPLLGDAVLSGFWPRKLDDGFLSCDRELFLAETAIHPSLPGRALTSRRNRLYGTRPTTGDRWQPVPLGHGIEILHEPTTGDAKSSSIEVLDTPGGMALGFPAQRSTCEPNEDERLVSRLRSLVGQPFPIEGGTSLALTFSNGRTGAYPKIEVPITVGAHLPAAATAAQLAAYLTDAIGAELRKHPAANRPKVTVLPVIWPRTFQIFVLSTDTGQARRISVAGDATARLGVVAREYTGADRAAGGDALPAMAEFRIVTSVPLQPPLTADLSGKRLVLAREGGAHEVTIDFDASAKAVTPGDLTAILRARLPREHYRVVDNFTAWGIRLTATGPASAEVELTDDFVSVLKEDQGLDPSEKGRTIRIGRRTRFDLSPTGTPAKARRLRVKAGGQQTALTSLTDGFVGVTDLTTVTSVELCGAIRKMISAVPALKVRCDLDLYTNHTITPMYEEAREGRVTELAFGPAGSRRVWAGDECCRLYRSLDDGETWEGVPSFPPSGRYGGVEAIAVHPDAPDTVLVGVFEMKRYADTVQFLFRTKDGGKTWDKPPFGRGIVDGEGHAVGVSAIEIDPAAPEHVFVGTEVGVFGSTDGGSTFTPMNEGLPNTPVVDLALARSTRMLRAALWGRGVYERQVGTSAPKDVRLHIRTTALDDGVAQPYPGPDLLARSPAPLPLDASPDIKQTRRDPVRGLVLDGVEFDDELQHEDVRVGAAFVSVQIHNRGAFSTSTARTAVLWAPADDGPPPLDPGLGAALRAGPLAVGTRFGRWTVLGDGPLPDKENVGHDVVAPGYPRVAVVGAAPAFTWKADDLRGRSRVGLLALVRSDEDHLEVATADVLDLIRTEPKAAYRECDVVDADEDARILLRATGSAGFQVKAPSPSSVRNLANGAAPLGLSVAPAGSREVELARAEPYDLSGTVGGFAVSIDHELTIPIASGEQIRDPRHATADEIAAIVNRECVAAGVPVRATTGHFTFVKSKQALFLSRLGVATFAVSGTAAARFGVTAGQGKEASTDTPSHGGPWDVRPAPDPLELRLVVRTPVEIRLGKGTPGIPDEAAATAAEVRAAINRQLDIGAAYGLRAEAPRLRLSVRRSATEAAASRVVSGGYAVADLFAADAAIASADARLARLRAGAAQDLDALAPGKRNFLYVRVANVGTLRGNPARVRIFEIGGAAPFPVSLQADSSATQALGAGQSAVLEVPFELDARPSGSRVFVLAVADTPAEALEPPDAFDSLENAHRFCLDEGAAALRELVVR